MKWPRKLNKFFFFKINFASDQQRRQEEANLQAEAEAESSGH